MQAVEAAFDGAVAELCELARIPGVSAEGYDPAEVTRSADAVVALLEGDGLEHVDVLRIGDAHPYVVADWLHAGPEAPTLLLYAHHDVQPPGREAYWKSPPFEPTERGDGRLYGRGIVDDKAGVLVFSKAVRAWLDTAGAVPVNVKLLIEGEEEIGSPHLGDFLRAHRERLISDVMVLSDTANLATGLPSLTTSLRGLVSFDVTVRALDHPLHSGMWGGAVPDAATALGVVLGRLIDAQGEPAIPGFEDDLPPLAPAEQEALAALPYDEAEFRRDAGVVASARLGARTGPELYERLWRKPALAITALEGMPLATAASQLIAEARARVGVRLAPGQDPERMTRRVTQALLADPPWGVEIEVESDHAAGGWSIEPTGPAFDAASRALRLGYGREPVMIGCGGTIPFVGPLTEVLGGVPALLLGLEDPTCNAHGENESLHLGDFRKALRAGAAILGEFGSDAG